MKRSRPGWTRRLAIAVALIVTATVGLVDVAYADTGGAITGSRNASDPDLVQCPTSSGHVTLCLYTSQDLDTQPIPYGPERNFYPMDKTEMFQLLAGSDPSQPANWIFKGYAVSENQLNSLGIGVVTNTLHLWAPGAVYLNGAYYVFVPDVFDRSHESTSSRLYLFKSTNINGVSGFTYQGRVQTPNSPNLGYASDPMVMPATNPYLIYANGDNGNCGSLSIGQLTSASNYLNFASTPQVVNITGIESSGLGTCNGAPTGHPYLEGAALYGWWQVGAPASVPWNYMIEFAAKPNLPPNGNGSPPGCSSSNEVIAYATAPSQTGPYTYGGLLMCGSDSEWTNQASIMADPYSSRILFAYHDGGGATHSRKTHLQCLTWNGNTPNLIPRSATNMSNC